MRTLSETLLAAQKQASAVPFVKIEAMSAAGGVIRADWNRLYEGSEDDYYHSAAMAGDGSMVRVRVTPLADSRKLYRQLTINPGPGSDFSQWEYTGQYNAIVVAVAARENEVSLLWVKSNREIRRFKSVDYGANWGNAELIDYSATTVVNGLTAAYKPNNDLAIFFIDQNILFVKRQVDGQWQAKSMWNKSTGVLSGVTAAYDGDWLLLLTGKDTDGNYKIWSLIFGDGGVIPVGEWSELKEMETAPAAGQFEYRQPFIDKPDVFRFSFVEKYTGAEQYNRPFFGHTLVGSGFNEGLWQETEPFDLDTEYGLVIVHYGNTMWMSSPNGVWRASLETAGIDLTGDVIEARQSTDEISSRLVVELGNDDGKYVKPGEGDLAIMDIGCWISFGAGYLTDAGVEYSPGPAYRLRAYEHIRREGKASLVLHTCDGWQALADWRARQQLRWNRDAAEMHVRDIVAFVLARVGLKLEIKSQSEIITGFFPDFTVRSGENGTEVINKLLSFVPDILFIEGDTAYLVNPQSADDPVYGYGTDHVVFEVRYRRGAIETNHVQVEGSDSGGGIILKDSFRWQEIESAGERIIQIGDCNLSSVEAAEQRGEAVLRKTEIAGNGGQMTVPVNCGQQMYDVIEINDVLTGMEAEKTRVVGMELVYRPLRGEYHQRLIMGGV